MAMYDMDDMSASGLASRAEDAAARGDTAAAMEMYEEAMALDPENARFAAAHESLAGASSALDSLFENMAMNKAAQRYTAREPAAPAAPAGELPEAEELCRRAERGDASGIAAMLEAGADVSAANELRHYDAPLHCAKNAATCRALLERGAAVDGPDASTWTPLMAAIRFGRADVARALLAAGADANRRRGGRGPDSGRSALMACTSGSALQPEARAAMAADLLARGADPRTALRNSEWTNLHDACAADEIAVALLLLDAGANVNATSTQVAVWDKGSRCTPYDVAKGNGFDELAAILAERGGARFADLFAYAGPAGRI